MAVVVEGQNPPAAIMSVEAAAMAHHADLIMVEVVAAEAEAAQEVEVATAVVPVVPAAVAVAVAKHVRGLHCVRVWVVQKDTDVKI